MGVWRNFMTEVRRAVPWTQVPTGNVTRDIGHDRIETRTGKAAHVDRLDFSHARQAIKLTRRRQNRSTAKIPPRTIYLVTLRTPSSAPSELPATSPSPKTTAIIGSCEHLWTALLTPPSVIREGRLPSTTSSR
jgi:hypothetical protein